MGLFRKSKVLNFKVLNISGIAFKLLYFKYNDLRFLRFPNDKGKLSI